MKGGVCLSRKIFDGDRKKSYFLSLYGRYVPQYESFLTIFSFYWQIEIRLVAIIIEKD